MVNTIILIASLVTALTVIIAAVIKVYKFIRKWEMWIEKKDKHDEAQYRDILRLIIMTPEMPLSERISAGDVYVNQLHGNGGVKQKYLELLQRFSEEHKE
jgi:H+/gluconate symporter-like permease